MKVLILGSGAREHTIAWKFSKSKRIAGLYTAPGNAGTDEIGENLPDVDPEDAKSVIAACKEHQINLVFVGAETPLASGIIDKLKAEGIEAIGPHKKAAQLEASKTFSKKFMLKHKIPTAKAEEFTNLKNFEKYINNSTGKLVIKKSGLAAGKGVLESDSKEELLEFGRKILIDDKLLVEEFLEGYEISIFTLSDGETYIKLPVCADFKKAKEDDKGLNTGGMGAICPVPIVNSEMLEEIEKKILKPTFNGLKKDKLNYKGVLYFGLMMTKDGPKLLEYNVRFGDPETQVLLPLIKSDFGNLCDAIINNKLEDFPIKISNKSALCVVVASEGYPGPYKKGLPVNRIPTFPEKDVVIFHASTKKNDENQVLTGGGRCFTVSGIGQDLLNASARAYESAPKISFEGAWFRKDIGKKFFIEE